MPEDLEAHRIVTLRSQPVQPGFNPVIKPLPPLFTAKSAKFKLDNTCFFLYITKSEFWFFLFCFKALFKAA